MSEHTPGPWEFWNERANGDDTLNIQTTGNGELIAMVDTDWVLPITGGNHTANARLIAAAPDLLAAVDVGMGGYSAASMMEEAAEELGDTVLSAYLVARAGDIRAAIAKAKVTT